MAGDPRVDAYIAKARPFARPILERIRSAVHAASDEIEESIKWGAPAFLWRGRTVCLMAAFKGHATLSLRRGKELDLAALGIEPRAGEAMGELGRIGTLDDLPAEDRLVALVCSAIALEEAGPASAEPGRRAVTVPPIPPAFAEALAENAGARATFEGFPPGARRDYVEWIAEAKREATRDRRIATAIEWLAEGKRRNWKYEKC